MTQPVYFLAAHVFLCIVDRYCVFLDLEQNRYLCLDVRQMNALNGILQGWTISPGVDTSCTDDREPDTARILTLLSSRRMITTHEEAGKAAVPTSHTTPQSALAEGVPAQGKLTHLTGFFTACIRAASDLRDPGIRRAVRRVRRRKQRHERHERAESPSDLDPIRKKVAVFQTLRPWFPKKYLCLFDSLALVEFLAMYDLYPDWVFGIRMDPFEAHCWVQQEEVVLNDTLDYVRQFAPIMVA